MTHFVRHIRMLVAISPDPMNLFFNTLTLLLLQIGLAGELSEQQNIWERIDKRAAELKNGRTEFKTPENINSDFSEFFKKFVSDSTFQSERVNPEVLAAVGLCESTKILNQSNWEFISFDYNEGFEDPRYEHLIISDEDTFYLQSTLIEVGVILQIGFKRTESDWEIVLYMLNVC